MSNIALYLGSFCALITALLHFACLFLGAKGYRFLGAGNSIVEKAQKGHWYPHFTAIVVGTILLICSAYALTTALGLPILPFHQPILLVIATVFLLRAALFPLIKARFAGNSDLFWYVSSSVCFVMGMLYLVGVVFI